MDPKYGTKAVVNLKLSENFEALKKHIDNMQIQRLNCILRYSHKTQTTKDMAIWVENQKLYQINGTQIEVDYTPIHSD